MVKSPRNVGGSLLSQTAELGYTLEPAKPFIDTVKPCIQRIVRPERSQAASDDVFRHVSTASLKGALFDLCFFGGC